MQRIEIFFLQREQEFLRILSKHAVDVYDAVSHVQGFHDCLLSKPDVVDLRITGVEQKCANLAP